MASSDSEVRRRVTTLYSKENEGGRAPRESSPGGHSSSQTHSTSESSAGFADQINSVADSMFSAMCYDLEREVITKDNIDKAIQNLFFKAVDPTKSMMQTKAFAQSSDTTKTAIKKLLMDALHASSTNQVRYLCMLSNNSFFFFFSLMLI